MNLHKRMADSSGRALPQELSGPSPSSSGSSSGPGLLAINARYFALRAVIFAAVLTAVLALGVHWLLGFAVAVVLSGLVSYPLAIRQRRAVLGALAQRRGWLR
ncbi:hypothetical protein [Candidatus Protofrankia californiensis]|uniref:hypothetical protein n=1 Tax=Candidatus Protofrankia californiensis TaxID=1839754 RepID=UPI001F499AFA|nr:hypothetical protein [Candidatus Protofrankia californiensis]